MSGRTGPRRFQIRDRTRSVAGAGGLRERVADRVPELRAPRSGARSDERRDLDRLERRWIGHVRPGARVDGLAEPFERVAVAKDVDVDAGRSGLVETLRVERDRRLAQRRVVA